MSTFWCILLQNKVNLFCLRSDQFDSSVPEIKDSIFMANEEVAL